MAKQAIVVSNFNTNENTVFPGESEVWSDWDSKIWQSNGCTPFVVTQENAVLDKIYYSPSNPNPKEQAYYLDHIELHPGVSDCYDKNPLRIYIESPEHGTFTPPKISTASRAQRLLQIEEMERNEKPRFDPLVLKRLEEFLEREASQEFDLDPLNGIIYEEIPKLDHATGENAWLSQEKDKKEGYFFVNNQMEGDTDSMSPSREADIDIEAEGGVLLGPAGENATRVGIGIEQDVSWKILEDPITGMEIAEYTIWPDYIFARPTSVKFVSKLQ
ncbi:hypothetical protein TWF481_000190 [Arthrobotrys musiformis]|uniref:Uncharacterized protein n=1 Tax=Arthrobotrys musiformis TaxID=47236 RepID=A0AAV9WMZ0_9PEZI